MYHSLWTRRRSFVTDSQGYRYPTPGDFVLTLETFGVDAEKNFYTVACPLGDLRGSHSRIEPRGQARMAEVVGPKSQRRTVFFGRKG